MTDEPESQPDREQIPEETLAPRPRPAAPPDRDHHEPGSQKKNDVAEQRAGERVPSERPSGEAVDNQ
jgi:hypothetical protein